MEINHTLSAEYAQFQVECKVEKYRKTDKKRSIFNIKLQIKTKIQTKKLKTRHLQLNINKNLKATSIIIYIKINKKITHYLYK
ncbi:hypothetical protein ACOTAH_08595 [Mannheimia haemolytica]|uniref:hypothetical protein n=1 Tax=Mannheimia haemolytica TaxID=75985 RepID=UPI003BA17075